MGGGDLNAKKAWHPNTLKNQERVWKAEQAAAEENKRIAELERERLLERERAELNKLAKSSLAHSSQTGHDRLHWMYEKPDKKVQQEEYLLGKAIDKSHEQAGKSEPDEIPAVSRRVVGSSMLTVAGDTQVDLARKMREDPLLLVKERERAARAALLNNPVQRARLAELLRKEQKTKKESKSKKKKKSKDLDNILAEKLQALSGKKGIDLASLLASDDSSSDSSDEKSKRKKKKSKKKSKDKNVTLDDSNSKEQTHKSNHDSKNESKKVGKHKRDAIEGDSNDTKRKKRHHAIQNNPIESNDRGHCMDSSEDQQSSDDNNSELRYKSKYGSKKEIKRYNSSNKSNDYTSTKGKKKHHHSDSNDDRPSSDEQQNREDRLIKTTRNYVSEDRYWSNKQYSSEDQKLRNRHEPKDKYMGGGEQSRKEKYSEENKHRYERGNTYRDSRNLQDKYKYEKDRAQSTSASDKSWRNNKRSGLSEAEKASKLAEMVAAGAEREKQRERRVADQLAEKETEDRPSSHSRSRNVVHQLPDSLESRIHSNRHYIQRDQRHMNENFARR